MRWECKPPRKQEKKDQKGAKRNKNNWSNFDFNTNFQPALG
jgi:hypothetical protein